MSRKSTVPSALIGVRRRMPWETAESSQAAVHGNRKFRASGSQGKIIWPEKVAAAGRHVCWTQIGACTEAVNSESTHHAETAERAQCQTREKNADRLHSVSRRN